MALTTTSVGAEVVAPSSATSGPSDHRVTARIGGIAGYMSLRPRRLLDTRDGGIKTLAGSITTVPVTGLNGVPADATAVALNIIATEPDAPGFVTVFACGTPQPATSNINFDKGQTIANSVTATIGSNGDVCVFTFAATHLIVDLKAAYSPSAGTSFLVPMAPQRLFDSRTSGTKALAGTVTTVHVGGISGMPADATAVGLNVTATEPDGPGFVTVFPCNRPRSVTSTLNFDTGQTIANSVTASIDPNGDVCLFTYATTHLIVDLNAAYSSTAGTSFLVPMAPKRLLDSRDRGAEPLAGSITTVHVTGVNGVPADATAVELNVTATESNAPGFVTVFACGTPRPATSNVNFEIGQTIANTVTATVGTNGDVCMFTYAAAHLVVDVEAAYSPIA